ncbi:MAG: LysR family transcriptional regulator [Anaerovoracaceae bacterium]
MLNLYELEQLVVFADLGTLSKVSEHLNISQPTITRSMQNLESEFGVELFIRSKNRIELNENGQLAVTYARGLLNDADKAVNAVRAFDKSKRTITVCSCAPAPLWTLLPKLNSAFHPVKTYCQRLQKTTVTLRSFPLKFLMLPLLR